MKLFQNQAEFDKNKELRERGATFFASEPNSIQQNTGVNYIALLLEMIKYWNIKYGPTEKVPRELFKKLSESQGVTFPGEFNYYKTAKQAQPGQPDRPGAKAKPDVKIQPGNQGNQRPAIADTKAITSPNKNAETIKAAKELVNNLKSIKGGMKEVYENNSDPMELEVLKSYYDALDALSKEAHQKIDLIVSNPAPDDKANEAVLNDLFQQNEQVDLLVKEFQAYSSNTTKWQSHRANVLAIFFANEKAGTPDNTTPIERQQQGVSDSQKIADLKANRMSDSERVLKAEEEKLASGASGVVSVEKKKLVASGDIGAMGRVGISDTVSQFVPAREVDNKISGGADEHADELEIKLIRDARKIVSKLWTCNASDLYEDADDQNQQAKVGEIIRKQKENEKEEQTLREEKLKQEQVISDKKAKEEERTQEKQRIEEEKMKETQRLAEEKQKNEAKAREEPRVSDEKTKEDQPLKDKKTQEEQKEKQDSQKLQKEKQEKAIVPEDNATKPPIGSNTKSPALSKLFGATFTTKTNNPVQSDTDQQQSNKGMIQSFKLDQSKVSFKFASELKLMEQSIKGARDRSMEMDAIKDGIKQSFIHCLPTRRPL